MKIHPLPFLVVLVAACTLGGSSLSAAPCCENQPPENYFEKMSIKFWRGVVNVATCPVEIPKQIHTTTRDLGVPGPFVGLLKGVLMTVYRGVGGAVETGSFPVPAPKNYEPLLKPAYVWQGWASKPTEPTPLTISQAVTPESQK